MILIMLMGVLFISCVLVVRELQLNNIEEEQPQRYEYKDTYLFENFNLALKVRYIFLPPTHPDKLAFARCNYNPNS